MAEIILSNGSTLLQALKKFRSYKKKTKTKQADNKGKVFFYYSIEEYVQRLDEAFGLDGYTITYSDYNVCFLPSEQVVASIKCRIDVLDVNRTSVYWFEGFGTYEFIRTASTGKYANLGTAGTDANSNALKAACTSAGIFGCRAEAGQSETATASDKVAASSSAKAERPQAVTKEAPKAAMEKTFHVEGDTMFVKIGEDTDGNGSFSLEVREYVGGKKSDKKSLILFYPNSYKGCIDKFNEARNHFDNSTKGGRFVVKVKPVSEEKRKDKDKYEMSYVFSAFAS